MQLVTDFQLRNKMWDSGKIKNYWRERAQKSENPCHYMNKWQDLYANKTRLRVLKKRDFTAACVVVDIGCGTGDYTAVLAKLAPEVRFLGFDFSFNIQIAKKKYSDSPNVEFREGAVPGREIKEALESADLAIMTTVYQHLPLETRDKLIGWFSEMKPNARVMLLEYAPQEVPLFQKGLGYKEVESCSEIIRRFSTHHLEPLEKRDVNFIDSFFFYHLGANVFAYFITVFGEWLLRIFRVKDSKYKLIIFKVA